MEEDFEDAETENTDTAHDIHQIGLSKPRKPYWENVPILEDLPFVVIGDFVYLIGHDDSLWQAPYVTDYSATSRNSVLVVHWDEAVEVSESTPSAVFPLERLKNVISDLQNITDIMHQHGVKTETDK